MGKGRAPGEHSAVPEQQAGHIFPWCHLHPRTDEAWPPGILVCWVTGRPLDPEVWMEVGVPPSDLVMRAQC